MSVYIEYVIIDNFTFTVLICYLSFKILRERVMVARCIIASIVGTACAVTYPLIKNAAVVVIFKVALYVIMCLILYLKLPKFIKRSLTFLFATAIIGGIQFMIGFAVYGNVSAALRLPVSELPLSIFFIPPIVLFFLSKKLLDMMNAHRLKQNYIYDFIMTVGEKSLKLRGLIDTGNGVKADRDVIFINKLTALDLLENDFFKMYENSENKYITVQTAVGSKKIVLFPAKIELYSGKDEHIFMNVQVGISDIKINGEYEAILPLSILGKEKVL